MITKNDLNASISFQEYLQLTQNIIESKEPPPPYDAPKMMKYTIENMERMKKVLHTLSIDQKLYNLLHHNKRSMVWVVLTEPWCGDASQIVPALAAFAEINANISFKILLSDTHTQIMDRYLTNGSRSIPKLVCIDEKSWKEIGVWGPRPQNLQQIVLEQKNNPNLSFGEKVRQIHAWYEENKTRDIQLEFIELLKQWNNLS